MAFMFYSNDIICSILEFLDTNLNRKISIEEISFKFSYNRYYLMKLFKKELGITVFTYINRFRIYHSILDIQNFDYSFTKVALRNGFYSLEYFSEMFHNIMGVSPRIYQTYFYSRFAKCDKEIDIIQDNLVELQTFVNFIKEYKRNRKPSKSPVLKLSLFR